MTYNNQGQTKSKKVTKKQFELQEELLQAKIDEMNKAAQGKPSLGQKYRGVIPKEFAESIHAHLAEIRKEW
jgi:hypothetical protein